MCSHPAHSACFKGEVLSNTCPQIFHFDLKRKTKKPNSFPFPAAGNLTVCAEVGCDRQSVAQSLEGAAGSGCPTTAADAALHSPWECGMSRKTSA